ncbi:PrsW family intramembrane metalloprotease [Lipingzhangella sp. LS1_29]|uniref:PrsW family intramembrane metalloprotease n=1 Tax=Lipingzhangella rawalii TaxID=2055835 RepID=A0ABU2H3N7_9ACTN|nr:PrsW family intramembrane metalloprotease [Lipingzhangella rawalii]MDS1269916.1 PrsW family intramembrane metalloprotease [Lipingzhangella rawalii]
MHEQAMLTRDLVLRLCDGATEFDQHWLDTDRKVVAPFTAPRNLQLIRAIVAAGRKLGVDRLLICRTRPEHAYEPVTEVVADERALLDHIRSWGRDPTDFLVAVEDQCAAVLVTSGRLTVAAGPADFVRELVGPDISRARNRFAAQAQDTEDEELLAAALRYGCVDDADRPAPPAPDPVERLARRSGAVEGNADSRLGPLRAARGAIAWSLLVLVGIAAVLTPVSMMLPLAAGMVWLLVQLCLLARTRTVTVASLLRMLVLGALCTLPIAATERGLAAALGMDPTDPYAHAYVAVPVEEVGKLVPLLLVWLVSWGRWRRMAAVDYLLLAAAAGAGFWIVEQSAHVLGFWQHPAYAGAPVASGLDLGILTFLPGGVDVAGAGLRFSGHAVTTGLVGAALGIAVVGARRYGRWLWLLPPAALGWAALEHMNYNALLAGLETTTLTDVTFAALGSGEATRWVLLLLLLAAVLLDGRVSRAADGVTPRLPGRRPLARVRRRVYGRAVRIRVRIPPDFAAVFRRAVHAWARLPVTVVQTVAVALHELAVQLVAASRGPSALTETWQYVRDRREYAMGAGRADGRPWRRHPPRSELRDTETRLASTLGLAAGGVAALAGLVPETLVSGMTAGHAADASPGGAYIALSLEAAWSWLHQQPMGDQLWILGGSAALLGLSTLGWSLPRRLPHAGTFLRQPHRELGTCLGAFAPGQLPFWAVALLGLLVPRRVDRLLGAHAQPVPSGG